MKILMIHHSGLIGGGSKSFLITNKVLSSTHEVITYIPSTPNDLEDLFYANNLNPKKYSFRLGKIPFYSGGNKIYSISFWYHILNIFRQFKYWKRVINKEQPDLIICNSKVISWMSILFKNRKSICFVRETTMGNSGHLMNKVIKYFLEKFDVVIYLSAFDRDKMKLENAKSIVIPNFLEPDDYIDKLGKKEASKRLKINSEAFNVLFVGGINSLKGVDIAINSLKLLKNENVNLIIAGNDDGGSFDEKKSTSIVDRIKKRKSIKFSRELKKSIVNNKLEGKIKFIGIQKDISIAYSASDLLIFPMKKPHQARPVFEIGIQKKPVIVSDFENIKEYVVDDFNAITFKPNNYKELATAILKLKNDEVLYNRLGKNNYNKATKNHLKEDFESQILSVIEDLK